MIEVLLIGHGRSIPTLKLVTDSDIYPPALYQKTNSWNEILFPVVSSSTPVLAVCPNCNIMLYTDRAVTKHSIVENQWYNWYSIRWVLNGSTALNYTNIVNEKKAT